MATAGKLDQGRESFRQQAWAGAYALLSSADQVPMSVGEGFGQVSAQFRELGSRSWARPAQAGRARRRPALRLRRRDR
jgi:hypothetical protein